MTKSTKNRVIEAFLIGIAAMLVFSAALKASPWAYTFVAFPVLLAVYILLYGVEHSLRATAAWCMAWAVALAHRREVKDRWSEELGCNKSTGGLLVEDEVHMQKLRDEAKVAAIA